MARELYSLSSTDNQEPEVPDPAAQDSTVALATADAAPAITSTAAAASTNGANAQREITSLAARGTMSTVADPQAITNAVADDAAAISSSPADPQISIELGSTGQGETQFTAPINQCFTGAELVKFFLPMDAAAITGLLGLHDEFKNLKRYSAMTILLAFGLFTLSASLLIQKSWPNYAALAALVGATCVIATLFFIADVLLPPKLEPVVWVFAASFFAVLVILCCTVYKKGIRNSGEGA